MRKKSILIAVMLAFSVLSRAQVNEDTFGKAVNFLNCKSVELSLKKSQSPGVTAEFQKKCSCDDNPDFKTIKSAIALSETKTIELATEIEKVKVNEFKQGLNPTGIISLLSEDVFADETRYKKLFDFASKRKGDAAFYAFKTQLKEDLTSLISGQSQDIESNEAKSDAEHQELTLEERVFALETSSQSLQPKEKDWVDEVSIYLLFFATGLSIAAIVLSLKKRSSKFEMISNTKNSEIANILGEKDLSDSIRDQVNRRISQSDVIGAVLEKLRPEIAKLIEEKPQSMNTVVWNNPSQEFNQSFESKQAELKPEIFYLSTPNSDGSFNDSSVSQAYKEGASIYRFTKVGTNRAKFQIDEREASIKLALTFPDKCIDPVCEAVNAFNPKATRITTEEVGHAELMNDKWLVNKLKKAKIRYEG